MQARIIFITGTDTGVGKTVLTALLLLHLRKGGSRAFAIKPFCSGGTQDVDILYRIQDGNLSRDEINPFYFPEPVAPLISARKHKRSIPMSQVVAHIRGVQTRCETLLIEGSGGLLVPLGEGYTVADLISALSCNVVTVSANKLGTISHTLMTLKLLSVLMHNSLRIHRRPLSTAGHHRRRDHVLPLKVVLMGVQEPDFSSRSNAAVLAELLAPVPVLSLPFLGEKPANPRALKKNEKKIQKALAVILS
jgi:dethiobiotin synthase